MIQEDPSLHLAFHLLSTAMNSSKVYAALYYTYFYSNYSLEDYETDEYYYGDITDPDELERARDDNSDYEERKCYASYDYEELLDIILSEVNVDTATAYGWISEDM